MNEALIALLASRGQTLATAESCTGGLLGKLLTDVEGSSSVYLGGIISYAYAVKEAFLGVDRTLLEERGAVCEEVARQMAIGVRERLHAHWGVSTTGNAGPGADAKNPRVGEIYVACAGERDCRCVKLQLSGSRNENRENAAIAALRLLHTYYLDEV